MAGTEQHRAFFRDRHAGLFHRRFEIGRRYFRARRKMAQIDADALDDAVLQRVLVDRRAALAKMARRVDVGAAVVGHGKEHHAVAVDVAGSANASSWVFQMPWMIGGCPG